jgi:hypothetical protein
MPIEWRNGMWKRTVTLFALLLTSVLCLSLSASSQSTGEYVKIEAAAVEQVPSDSRARLTERLEDYVRSVNVGDLGHVYDLRPVACRYGLPKEEWLKQVRVESPGRLMSFAVEEVYAGDYTAPANLQGEKWIVRGCATYQKGRKRVRYKASISAVLAEGEWYVCSNGVAVEGKDERPIPCSGGI